MHDNILLIEEEEALRMTLGDRLRSEGYVGEYVRLFFAGGVGRLPRGANPRRRWLSTDGVTSCFSSPSDTRKRCRTFAPAGVMW